MHKAAIASSAIAATGIGLYLLTPMIAASRVEERLEGLIPEPPGVYVEKLSLDKGYRHSTATYRMTLDLALQAQPLVIYLDHDIEHGLRFDGTIATIRTSARVDGAYAEPARAWFGDRPPLEATTKVSALGAVHSTLVSPAFSYTPPGDESVAVVWRGLRATIERSAAARHFEYAASLPGLRFRAGAETMTVSGPAGAGRFAPHETVGATGASTVKIENAILDVDGPRIELDSAALDYVLEEDDGLIKFRLDGDIDALRLPGNTVKEIGWNLAIDNLNAQTYAGLLESLESMEAAPRPRGCFSRGLSSNNSPYCCAPRRR